jgi:thioredoxin 1
MASDKVIKITSGNFDEIVANSALPVLIDFWASWCGPCKAVAPIVDELAREYDGKFVVGKANVDEEADLAQNYNIMSIPTFIILKGGAESERIVGARSKGDLKKIMDQYL